MCRSSNNQPTTTVIKQDSELAGCFLLTLLIIVGLVLFASVQYSDYVKEQEQHRRENTLHNFDILHSDGILSDTLTLTNNSRDMKDVQATVTIYTENGKTYELPRRWASWPKGETKEITYTSPGSQLQKAEMTGQHTDGWIDTVWLFN